MAISLIQTQVGSAAFATSFTITLPNVVSGNFIVVAVGTNNQTTQAVSSMTDSQSNTYTKVLGETSLEIWYAKNVTGAASLVITISEAGASQRFQGIAREYSGIDTVSPLDRFTSQSVLGSPWSSGATAVTTQANELVVGAAAGGSTSTISAGSGYGNLQAQTAQVQNKVWMEDKIVSSTGAQTATFGVSPADNNNNTGVATFKASSLVTTTRDQTGKGRITTTATRTQDGLAYIQGLSETLSTDYYLATFGGDITTTRNQTGKASVLKTVDREQNGVARISQVVNQTQTGISRITQTVLRTVDGLSRITAAVLRAITGISRITTVSTQNIQGTARVTVVSTRTQTGTSRITVATSQNQDGRAKVGSFVDQAQTGISRITVTSTQPQTGISRITVVVARTQDGKAALETPTVQTQTGVSRIAEITQRGQNGVARVTLTSSQTTTGISKIDRVVSETQTGKALVSALAQRDQTGTSRVTSSASRVQYGKARVVIPIVEIDDAIVESYIKLKLPKTSSINASVLEEGEYRKRSLGDTGEYEEITPGPTPSWPS